MSHTTEAPAGRYVNRHTSPAENEEDEHKNSMEERVSFLSASKAIPTPMDVYAIWLELYLRQGGKLARVRDRDYTTHSIVAKDMFSLEKTDQERTFSYEGIGWDRWTPTKNGGQIPENYGSYAMTLLILPEATGQEINPATNDWRTGWEYGHTTVLTIVRDDTTKEGFRAETNKGYAISFNDVEALRASMDIYQMLAKYNMVRENSLEAGSKGTLTGEVMEDDTVKALVNAQAPVHVEEQGGMRALVKRFFGI